MKKPHCYDTGNEVCTNHEAFSLLLRSHSPGRSYALWVAGTIVLSTVIYYSNSSATSYVDGRSSGTNIMASTNCLLIGFKDCSTEGTTCLILYIWPELMVEELTSFAVDLITIIFLNGLCGELTSLYP